MKVFTVLYYFTVFIWISIIKNFKIISTYNKNSYFNYKSNFFEKILVDFQEFVRSWKKSMTTTLNRSYIYTSFL